MMTLALTDPGRTEAEYERYAAWVRRWVPDAALVRLAFNDAAVPELESCSGLILTGGGDVHPRYYGRTEVLGMTHGVDESRDEFEFRLIDKALKIHLPVLGICRGAQVFNVARGGTLLPDIEHTGRASHRKNGEKEREHGVVVRPGSQLHAIVGTVEGRVNSSHHQAVDKPGTGLAISARSDDGIAEALEWERPDGLPFVLLVQWHPERMQEQDSVFSRGIIHRFSKEAGHPGGES